MVVIYSPEKVRNLLRTSETESNSQNGIMDTIVISDNLYHFPPPPKCSPLTITMFGLILSTYLMHVWGGGGMSPQRQLI